MTGDIYSLCDISVVTFKITCRHLAPISFHPLFKLYYISAMCSPFIYDLTARCLFSHVLMWTFTSPYKLYIIHWHDLNSSIGKQDFFFFFALYVEFSIETLKETMLSIQEWELISILGNSGKFNLFENSLFWYYINRHVGFSDLWGITMGIHWRSDKAVLRQIINVWFAKKYKDSQNLSYSVDWGWFTKAKETFHFSKKMFT